MMCVLCDVGENALLKGVAGLSKDSSTKVGAVLKNSFGNILSYGYNGLPSGMDDGNELYQHKGELSEDKPFHKYDLFEHAEMNCIYNWAKLNTLLHNQTNYMIVGEVLSAMDIRAIASSGIKRVYLGKVVENGRLSFLMSHVFDELGIECIMIDDASEKMAGLYEMWRNSVSVNNFCAIYSKENILITMGFLMPKLLEYRLKQSEMVLSDEVIALSQFSVVKSAILNLIANETLGKGWEIDVSLAPCFACSMSLLSVDIKPNYSNLTQSKTTSPIWQEQQNLFQELLKQIKK